jgi:Transposase DDE domain group 1
MTQRSCTDLTFFSRARQQVSVAFDGPDIVSDTGLLTLRDLDRRLGFLEELARRLPDPRAQEFVTHTTQDILVQQVYQILADYADCNDAAILRHDALFRTLVGRDPDDQRPLASGSTLARFQYAFTRRQLELPPEDRPAFREMYQARTHRLSLINQFLVDTFIRTRRQVPAYVILDLDPTDDPTHGRQALSGYHGYYQQHQYFPLLVFDGDSGFPLAAWLRPGTAHGALGAVAILEPIVCALRQAWPGVLILVRGDSGLAVPAVYEFCESWGLLYAFGYASNAVLQRRTQAALWHLEVTHFFVGPYEPHLQRFEVIEDYQADGWSRPRRVLCKLECTPQGSQRRFVVTNLSGDPGGLYRGFYVQRGEVPEQPLDELKNGLDATRLSASSFRANAYRLLLQVVAYALVVLFREAVSGIEEVCRATVSTLRTRLWKVGAAVSRGVGELCFHVSATWPWRELWCRVHRAVASFVGWLAGRATVPRVGLLGMSARV